MSLLTLFHSSGGTLLGWCNGSRSIPQMIDEYPGTQVVRIFRSSGDGLPGWTSAPLSQVPAGVHTILSWKDWPYDVSSWLDDMPASRRGTVWLTYHHEPEQQGGGDPTPTDFKSNWVGLCDQLRAHPKRSWIKLAPIYTQYWATHGGHDWHDFWPLTVAADIDAIGWDVYNGPQTAIYQDPADLLAICNQVAAETGKPYFVGEWGAERILSDPTGAGCATWMVDFVDHLNSFGARAACWFHVGGSDLISTRRSREKNTLSALISGSHVVPQPGEAIQPPGSVTVADTLAAWGFNFDAPLVRLDFGTVPPRSSSDVRFRVKNRSGRYIAQGVSVSLRDSPNPAWEYLLSLDGETFAASVSLGSLAASAVSPVIWLRRTTPSTAIPGSYECQLRVSATAWSTSLT